MNGHAALAIKLVAGLLVGMGIFVRFWHLDLNGFWEDELISLAATGPGRSIRQIVFETLAYDVHPPLYFVVLSWWRAALGDGETTVRALSAILSSASVGIAFVVGRKLLPPAVLRYFLVLLACSYGSIIYAQEARPYALLLLLSTVLSLLFVRIWHELGKADGLSWASAALLGAISTLTAFTHYFGLLFVGSIYLVLGLCCVGQRRRTNRLLASALGVLLVVAPWILYELPRKAHLSGELFWPQANPSWYLSQLQIWAWYTLGPATLLLVAVLVYAVLTPTRSLEWPRDGAAPTTGLLAISIVTVGLAAVVSIDTPVIVARYFLVIVPAVYLAIAYALVGTKGSFLARRPFLAPIIVVSTGILMFTQLAGFFQPFKQEVREASAYLLSQSDCRGAIIPVWVPTHWLAGELPIGFYIAEPSGVRLAPVHGASPVIDRQLDSTCPIVLWVWKASWKGAMPDEILSALELGGQPLEIVPFRDTYFIRRRLK